MKIINCEQGTPEWIQSRLGLPTASNFDKLITSTGTPSTQSKKYMFTLAGEFVSGCPEETYQNGAMARGTELEKEARELYQMVTDREVDQVGFCLADCGKYGASPDGFVGEDGLIEIKCPKLSGHVEYLINGKLPTTYVQQVQGQLLVTGRKWVDFMSYYPTLKPLIVRVERDEKFIGKLSVELDLFCEKLKTIINKIK